LLPPRASHLQDEYALSEATRHALLLSGIRVARGKSSSGEQEFALQKPGLLETGHLQRTLEVHRSRPTRFVVDRIWFDTEKDALCERVEASQSAQQDGPSSVPPSTRTRLGPGIERADWLAVYHQGSRSRPR